MNSKTPNLLETLFNRDREALDANLVTEKIIGCAYKVSNSLGCGFLEKVYENSLAHEIQKCRLKVEQQKAINVFYDGIEVGYYEADLLVENEVLVELKTVRNFDENSQSPMPELSQSYRVKTMLTDKFWQPTRRGKTSYFINCRII